MSSLYEITDQFKELAVLQETADEDLAVAIRDTMQGIEAEFNDKAKAVTHIILNLDSDVDALDREIARLQERKRLVTNRQREIKEYLRENMEAAGITKISCPLFTITCAKGRESVVVDDENALPDELMRVKTEITPDKTAIAAKIKAGEEVPGARLERGQSSIRIK